RMSSPFFSARCGPPRSRAWPAGVERRPARGAGPGLTTRLHPRKLVIDMPLWSVILVAILGWIAAVVLVRLLIGPLRRCAPDGDPVFGLMLIAARVYTRLIHRVRHRGQEA